MMSMGEQRDVQAEIAELKEKLNLIWKVKGQIDQDVLALSETIDQLINVYYEGVIAEVEDYPCARGEKADCFEAGYESFKGTGLVVAAR
jgi:hypothetical protein